MKRTARGLLHLTERHKTHVVRLAHFFKRPANAHVTRQSPAAIGRPFKGGDGDGHRDRRSTHFDGAFRSAQPRSTHMAMPMPPPMQSVARPFLALRFCISNSSVVRTRAPEAPIGCPIAMAPPFTLTLPVSQPRS